MIGIPSKPIITSVDNKYLNGIPDSYQLYQNYPNPFNPSTTIRFSIPSEDFVTLKVYDVIGREVKTLINEKKSVGKYEIDFNASQLASGIYFYQIKEWRLICKLKK